MTRPTTRAYGTLFRRNTTPKRKSTFATASMMQISLSTLLTVSMMRNGEQAVKKV
jgi:hypothetical protein